jgi:CheY-like chemotaxis protein
MVAEGSTMTTVHNDHSPVLLVVEDSADQRMLIREFVSELLPCELREAPDGLTAMVQARDCRPNLVLLDLHIPPHGGLQVLQELRADATLAQVPVIVMSGSRAPADLATIEAAGGSRFIEKPYDLDELESAIFSMLS